MKKGKLQKIEYNGLAYKYVSDLAYDKGKNRRLVYYRLSKGWTLKKAVETESQHTTSIVYNGVLYSSIVDLAIAQKQSYGLIRSRLSMGWSINKAVETPKAKTSKRIPIAFKGKSYPSLLRLAQELKLPLASLLNQIRQKGMDVEAAAEYCLNHRRTVTLWGNQFDNLFVLAENYGVKYWPLLTLIKKGWNIEESVSYLIKQEPIRYNGKNYETLSDFCGAFYIQPEVFWNRVRRKGMSIDDALSEAIEPSNHGKEVVYEGKTYRSQVEICTEFGLSAQLVRDSARRLSDESENESVVFLKAFKLYLELKNKAGISRDELITHIPGCVIRGKTYNTIQVFCREYGISYASVTSYRRKHHTVDLFDTLRNMQLETKILYLHEGKAEPFVFLKKMKIPSCVIAKKQKVFVPRYPLLLDKDFKNGCIDTQQLFKEIKKKYFLKK